VGNPNKGKKMKTQYILFVVISVTIGVIGGCAGKPFITNDKSESGAMPLQGENVLWISSIPLGADVYLIKDDDLQRSDAKSTEPNTTGKKGPSMSMHNIESTTVQHETGPFSQPSLGKTPLAIEVPDGNYIIGVQLDVKDQNIAWKFAAIAEETGASGAESTLIDMWKNMEVRDSLPAGEIGLSESGTGYLNEGNQELWAIITEGLVRKVGKTYSVQKKTGETATVIALFQRQDEDPQKLYEMLPADYKFRSRMLHPSIWKVAGVPNSECTKFHERLMRGGKAVYLGKKKYVLCEFTPLDQAVPSERRTGGFTMRLLLGN
jgi:hypothetical protein